MMVNIAATDGEPAVDNRRNSQDKPNIMITARLLLMPVLRSVELKPPPACANADSVLRRSIAATMSTERSRERPCGGSLDLGGRRIIRSEEHTSELQSRPHLVCRLLLEKK